MANKNNEKEQLPPNPFLLTSASTFTTPGSLFSRPQGAGEGASTILPSSSTTTPTTTTGIFGAPSNTAMSPTPFTSLLFTRQAPAEAQTLTFRTSALRPSPGVTSTLSSPPKDTAAISSSSIFSKAPTNAAAVPSSLFGGAKNNTATGSSVSTRIGDSATDLSHLAATSSTVTPVFGGSGGRPGGFGGAAGTAGASQLFGGPEAVSSVFGSTSKGVEGQTSSFGQFGAPVRATMLKEMKKSEVGLPSASSLQDMASAGSMVFGGGTSSGPIEAPPSLLAKPSSSFGSPKALAKAGSKAAITPDKDDKTKGRKESQSSSPEYNKKEVTKILVTCIPDNCMNRDFLRAHFSKFGEIVRLVPNVHARQATVIYTNHHGASRAKRKGRKLHPMLPEVKIYYGQPARRRSEEAGLDAAQAKKKAIKTLQQVHHPSDLDPYTPLERPGAEAPGPLPSKQVRPRVTKSSASKAFPPPTAVSSRKLSVPTATKKKGRSKSPAREAKEPPTVTTDEGNLAASLDMAAQNNNDRYNILKARDKLLRRERHRTSDLQQASYLSATCPDMCPELERYMRDVQFDLSSTFEMTNGTLDHRLVTKKFSRSSADKELPLPHELRPGQVLLMTMNFLVCNVISRVEEEGMEVDVWYNYLWNRTRAVRNDLMQQQLTDATAVAIMERCTRFHIYAAARLCEEPPDLYDSKMNTEHLTKSLQTLKELYHDLGEQGCYFSSEAEFRAYEMLLSLNDGEAIVNKYSQFREEVQKSSHVQFALKVIQAVTFNNYVKFFRLVRGSSTYLQGCLLHRYFRQVRSRALGTIIRSHVSPKGPQAIPLHTLTHILGFENEVEAVLYLQCHGIKVTDSTVILDRHSFVQSPEEVPPPVRPLLLVEKNRTVSIGEVIQGGSMPSNPLHTHIPHDSFDSQGRLKPGARDASDQSGNPATVPIGLGLAPVVQQAEAMQNYALVSHMKDIYSMVEGLVLPQMVREVVSEVVETARQDAVAQSVASDLLVEGVQQEVEAVVQEGYLEVEREEMEKRRRKQEEQERQRKALEEMRKAVADMLHSEYSSQFVEAFVRQVCEEALWEVAEEVALLQLESELPLICLGEAVAEEVRTLSREAIQELVTEQEQHVEAFTKKLALRRMAEHFQVWRLQTQKAHRRKQSQMTFPASCSSLSLGQQNHALGWGYARDPAHNMSALQVTQLEEGIRDILKKLTVKNQLMRECAWHPLPLQHHVAALVAQQHPTQHNLVNQYFKILVCRSQDVQPEVMLWLRSKLGEQSGGQGAGHRAGQDILQPLNSSFSFISQRSGLEYAWVIREVLVAALTPDDLQGTALVLFVSSGQGMAEACRRKVRHLLAVSSQVVSFCEINFEGDRGESEEEWLLVEEDLVKPCTSDRLQSLLLESWKHQGKQVFITSSHLNDLANDIVVRHFLEPALRRHSERLTDKKSPMPPHVLIDLYNSTLDTLLLAVADEDLVTLSWPPSELAHLTQIPSPTWNNEDMKQVSWLVDSVRLPPLRLNKPAITWASLLETLHQYAATLAGSSGEAPVLTSHMDAILSEAWVSLEPFVCEEEEEEKEEAFTKLELHPLLVPWPQLIYTFASYKLSGLPDAKVYYQPHKLQHFPTPESWMAACGVSDPAWQEAVIGSHTYTSASRKRKAQREEHQVEKVTKVRTVHSQLLEDIAAEKRKCEEFEKSLESMLEVEEELKLLVNSSH